MTRMRIVTTTGDTHALAESLRVARAELATWKLTAAAREATAADYRSQYLRVCGERNELAARVAALEAELTRLRAWRRQPVIQSLQRLWLWRSQE